MTTFKPDLDSLASTTGISEAFSSLTELTTERCSTLIRSLGLELTQTDEEIHRQVRLQVHDSSFSTSLLTTALKEMESASYKLKQIDEAFRLAKETTPEFELLRKAGLAKRNLSSVIEQLELYGKVPGRVRRLGLELEGDPRGDNLRRVFREWLGLSAWRDRVVGHVEDAVRSAGVAEERAWRRARGERVREGGEEEDARMQSSASYETMLALLKDHFRESFILGDRIFEVVWESVGSIFELAKNRPSDLVCLVEICERRDKQVARELKRREISGDERESKRWQFQQRIGQVADERAGFILKQKKKARTSSSNSPRADGNGTTTGAPEDEIPVDELLEQGNLLLNDLTIVARDVRPCMPREYDPIGTFRKWYEARLLRALSDKALKSGLNGDMTSEQMLTMAAWISKYLATIRSFYFDESDEAAYFDECLVGDDDLVSSYRDDSNAGNGIMIPAVGIDRLGVDLLSRYLSERRLPAIQTTIDSVLMLGSPSRQIITVDSIPGISRGFLKTSVPEDFFRPLMEEICTCAGKLTGERMLSVLEKILSLVTSILLPFQEKLSSAESFSVEESCAWLNDVDRCQDLVRSLFDACSDVLMMAKDVSFVIQRASDLVEEECSAFIKAADVVAGKVLVQRHMFRDLDEKVFPDMFTKEWEESKFLGIRIVCATLDDWLHHPTQGICEWIARDFYLGRVLGFCLETVIKRYVDHLLLWNCKFGSAKRAAGRVDEDAKALALFFRQHVELLKSSGSIIRSDDDVERRFRVLHQLADILQGDEYNLDPLMESLVKVEDARVVIQRLRVLRGGRVMNRREADLELELVALVEVSADYVCPFALERISALMGKPIMEFDGEDEYASAPRLGQMDVFASSPKASTDRQFAFVKKMASSFAGRSNAPKTFRDTPSASRGGVSNPLSVRYESPDKVNTMKVDEFISIGRTLGPTVTTSTAKPGSSSFSRRGKKI